MCENKNKNMNLLRIDSSVRIQNSKTRMLTDYFINELEKQKVYTIVNRDVGIYPPPFPTDDFIKANYTLETDRSNEMKAILKKSDTLIDELFSAEKIIIAAPMYNFSISATLKAYIDNIVRIGKTFIISDVGMQGLLVDKKIMIITSRGAMSYKDGETLQSFDFQENYLRALFMFLGVKDITFVHTEAQDFGAADIQKSNFDESLEQLTEIAKTW